MKMLYVGYFLLLFMGADAFAALFSDPAANPTYIQLRALLSVSVTLLGVGLLARGILIQGLAAARSAVNWYTLAYVMLCILSFRWSLDPSYTLSRSVVLFGILCGCVSLVLHARDLGEMLEIMLVALFFNSLTFLVYVAAFPAAVHPFGDELGGLWRGMYTHKNVAASSAATAVLVAATSFKAGIRRRLAAVCLFLAAVIAIGSGSKATAGFLSVWVALVILIPHPVKLLSRFDAVSRALVLAIVLAAVVGGLWILVTTTGALDDGRNFTGRVAIWRYVVAQFLDAPYLGYGYVAFFRTHADEVLYILEWPAPHAHNGYLDSLLDVGLAGLLLLASAAIQLLRNILFSREYSKYSDSVFFILIYIVLYNFVESSLMQYLRPLSILSVLLLGTNLLAKGLPAKISPKNN
jgi:exopolysaccharide production protein ExoQ